MLEACVSLYLADDGVDKVRVGNLCHYTQNREIMSPHRTVLVEILHQVIVALLALLVQHIFRRVLQTSWQVLVEHLTGLYVLGETAIALHDVLGKTVVLFIVVNQFFQHAV